MIVGSERNARLAHVVDAPWAVIPRSPETRHLSCPPLNGRARPCSVLQARVLGDVTDLGRTDLVEAMTTIPLFLEVGASDRRRPVSKVQACQARRLGG